MKNADSISEMACVSASFNCLASEEFSNVFSMVVNVFVFGVVVLG